MAAAKKNNQLIELIINIVIPSLILMKLSAEQYLGTVNALLLALAFPLGWGLYDLLRPYMNGHVYQNYPNRDLKDFAQAYWGDEAYLRLREFKTKYDPTNFFCYQQSIAPL